MVETKTRTQTVVGVALAVIAVGALGFVAGLYYYGSRPTTKPIPTQSAANPMLSCGGSMACVNNVFKENADKFYPSVELPQASSSSGVDLVGTVTKFSPLAGAGSGYMSTTYDVSVEVKNNGTKSAGAFNVGLYFSPVKDRVPDGVRDYTVLNGIEKLGLGSTSVSGLAAGASTTVNFKTVKRCGVGPAGGGTGGEASSAVLNQYPVAWVDNNNAVAETNESNNISSGKMFACQMQ